MIRADGAACAVCQIAPQHGRDRWDTLEEAAGSASKTMRTAWTAGLVLLIATTARADPTEPDDLPDPRPEIARNEPRVALPAVPGFELPVAEGGVHRPRELRVRGSALLLWVYIITPTVDHGSQPWTSSAVSIAYPLGDVMLRV